MGIFNHISKLSKSNIESVNTKFDIIWSDYTKKHDLLNYYEKSKPIDMGRNKITSLGDPTEDTDAINRSFLNKRISTASKNLKLEISTSITELTQTNNEKVKDLETKITRGATELSEMSKFINNEIKTIRSTYDELNKKDTLTADEIKKDK